MSEVTRELHLTDRQMRILCEGMKLVQGNPASADELATTERMLQHFQQLVGAAAQEGGARDDQVSAGSDGMPGVQSHQDIQMRPVTKEQMQERVRLLSDEMDANEEENRMMQAEIDVLYAQIDACAAAE